jgi:hypothetical protein
MLISRNFDYIYMFFFTFAIAYSLRVQYSTVLDLKYYSLLALLVTVIVMLVTFSLKLP